jgi:lysyl-tRNA synthetase class 2
MRPEKKKISMNETEKLVYENIFKENQLIGEVKDKIEISNKAWDKVIKSLRKLELIKVEKIENDIYISKIN